MLLDPVQPPDAVQEVALAADHDRLEVPPGATCAGFAEIETVGAGRAPTATLVVCAAVPPGPVQLNVYEKVRTVVRLPVDSLPLVAFAPVQSPLALQEFALLELQLNVEEAPCVIAPGLALNTNVGGGEAGVTFTVTVCDAVPPAPAQLSVNELVAVRALLTSDPARPLVPLHPPLAVQEEAFAEDQLSVEEPPLTTEAGVAVSETVGVGTGLTVTVTD